MRISDWSSDVCSSDLTVRPSYHYQTFFNVFSSPDLVHWTKHSHALDVENVAWAAYAVWAPSAIEKDGKYYLFFGANDIQSDDQFGGIGVAARDRPEGPFKDAIGPPLTAHRKSVVEGGSEQISVNTGGGG